jgi:spore germination protein YaaH
MPEWFFIDPVTDTLQTNIDKESYGLMKKKGIRILPMLNNVNLARHDGTFDPGILDAVLNNPVKRERLLNDIVKKIQQDTLQGINVDFEELNDKVKDAVHSFQKELYKRLHAKGCLVTQDIMAEDDAYNMRELNECNDYIFLMAYDQHYGASVPGPVSEQRWVEKELDEVAKKCQTRENSIVYGRVWLRLAGWRCSGNCNLPGSFINSQRI